MSSTTKSRRLPGALVCALVALASAGPASAGSRQLGVMLDAGLPDGAHASLVYHPGSWLRLHAGAGHNAISPGVRAGLSLVPPSWSVAPSLVVEAGRYFPGDANPLMRKITGDSDYDNELMREVGYDYANAHLGVELGGGIFAFYVHAGFSYIATEVRNLDAASDPDDGGLSFRDDPRLSGIVPSARLGVILYLH